MRLAPTLLCLLVGLGESHGWRIPWSAAGRATAAQQHPQGTDGEGARHCGWDPAVTGQWCSRLLTRGISCDVLGDLCAHACAHIARARAKTAGGSPAAAVAAAARREQCSAPLAAKHGVSLALLHGEDIYATFKNGVGGPAQRQVETDISGWGERAETKWHRRPCQQIAPEAPCQH